MIFGANNSSTRNWLCYAFVVALVIIAAIGPVLRTMDDDENLGLHAFPDTSLVFRARSTTVAYSAPAVSAMVIPQSSVHGVCEYSVPLVSSGDLVAEQPSPPNLSSPLRT